MGSGYPGGSPGGAGGGLAAAKGQAALQAAMADPLLISVKIGGLMTLYQSAQETETEAATEAAAVTEVIPMPPQTATETGDANATLQPPVDESNTAVSGDAAVIPTDSAPTSTDTQIPPENTSPAAAGGDDPTGEASVPDVTLPESGRGDESTEPSTEPSLDPVSPDTESPKPE